ncbi:MAG: tetratricopeptide repeat protein [Archangiaceae bacterium]|nr:tetratricopeptide repeat protein [Archangiaceae bacterium]
MLNLVYALAAGIVITVVIKLAGFSLIAGIIPGTIVMLGAYVVLARRTFVKVQAVMESVKKEFESMPANEKERKVKADKVIKMLEAALPLGKEQFLIESELHAQIGMIHHLFKNTEAAMASFSKTTPRSYLARAMQAAIYFQRKDYQAMRSAFEEAVKHGKKDGMVWAAYAWCLQQNKDVDGALKVLARSVAENPSDDKLKSALTALQNDKKLKMKAWEPGWWQFGLEAPPMQQPQFMGGGRRGRFMRR